MTIFQGVLLLSGVIVFGELISRLVLKYTKIVSTKTITLSGKVTSVSNYNFILFTALIVFEAACIYGKNYSLILMMAIPVKHIFRTRVTIKDEVTGEKSSLEIPETLKLQLDQNVVIPAQESKWGLGVRSYQYQENNL